MTAPAEKCPNGHELVGIGSKCWECGWVRPREEPVSQAVTGDRLPRWEPVGSGRTYAPDTRLEREVRPRIVETLENLGWAVYDMEQERETRQTPGPTDLIALGHGTQAFLEIKRPNRRGEAHDGLSKDQQTFRDHCLANGVPWAVLFDEADAVQFHRRMTDEK